MNFTEPLSEQLSRRQKHSHRVWQVPPQTLFRSYTEHHEVSFQGERQALRKNQTLKHNSSMIPSSCIGARCKLAQGKIWMATVKILQLKSWRKRWMKTNTIAKQLYQTHPPAKSLTINLHACRGSAKKTPSDSLPVSLSLSPGWPWCRWNFLPR